MSYNLFVTQEAELDIVEISQWYEQQKQGLSKEFLLSIKEVFELLIKNPFIFVKVYKEIHRALTKKFPYQLFYKIDNNKKIRYNFCGNTPK